MKTPWFQKCRPLTLSKHLFIRKLKKTMLHGLSIPNPNFSEFTFFDNYICRLGIVDFNLPSHSWVSQIQKSEFAVLVLGFEKLELELDNCGRTTKNANCRIYSLCSHHSERCLLPLIASSRSSTSPSFLVVISCSWYLLLVAFSCALLYFLFFFSLFSKHDPLFSMRPLFWTRGSGCALGCCQSWNAMPWDEEIRASPHPSSSNMCNEGPRRKVHLIKGHGAAGEQAGQGWNWWSRGAWVGISEASYLFASSDGSYHIW